jgi:superfamily II DNA or RNA helicase
MGEHEATNPARIRLYRSLFRGRDDVFARFWVSPTAAKKGYMPVYLMGRDPLGLTDGIIAKHFAGKDTIGIYPLLPDNTTYFLVIDLDHGNWLVEANRILSSAKAANVSAYLERSRSGDGGHIWLFFETNIPAAKARALGKMLLQRAGLTRSSSFDRLFPSQDIHTGRGLGNLIALPLQGKSMEAGNSAFIDEQGKAYDNQWALLGGFLKTSESAVEALLNHSAIGDEKSVAQMAPAESNPEDHEPPVSTTNALDAKLTLSSQISIPTSHLPASLYQFLKTQLNFPNPKFYEAERAGYSTHEIPRYIKNLEPTTDSVFVPAGMLLEIREYAAGKHIELTIADERTVTKTVTFKSKIKLRGPQQSIVRALLAYDRVILEANPGFGKTIIGLYAMAKIKQRTLIIVHTKALLQQWKCQLQDNFVLKPEDVGIIGDSKWRLGSKVTLASYQTLNRRGVSEIADLFGLVIIDECHHAPARTFTAVVKSLSAKKVLGLTATAMRRDQLERLMLFYIGPIVKEPTRPQLAVGSNQPAVTVALLVKPTNFTATGKAKSEFHNITSQLIADAKRNEQIVDDICAALESGAKCLVLTERVEHCQILLDLVRVRVKGLHGAVASGKNTRKERENLRKRLGQTRFKLLIATGKLVGEGFDWPELTHLFLVFPFTYRGKAIQYIGRLQRTNDQSQAAYVYDYADNDVPMLKGMYFKRLRAYRELGLVRSSFSAGRIKKAANNQLRLLQVSLFKYYLSNKAEMFRHILSNNACTTSRLLF